MLSTAFPLEAPFRIDQVTQAPGLMAALFLAQVLMALLIHLAGAYRRPRLWWGAAVVLLLLVLVFFTLASWGNSDTTRFSHYMAVDPERGPPEPLWRLLRPLVLLLPYRMAAVHGLVVAGYAAAPLLMARAWGVPAWGGWWSLLICCSPMLRGFMQNAHSRQALAVLLLLPLMLWAARQFRTKRLWLGLGVILSALTHSTIVWNLLISLTPLAMRLPESLALAAGRCRDVWSLAGWRRWLVLLSVLAGGGLITLVGITALQRLQDYSFDAYFSIYSIRRIVGRLQRALTLGVLLACAQKRLSPLRLLRCEQTRLLMVFGVAYLLIQASVRHQWLPQVTSRLADSVAFLLLISFLIWLNHYDAHWCVIPAVYVTFQYWFEGRVLPSAGLECGQNDDFLCVPDRWPWQVRW
ncbi:hypothetical protein KBZ18_07195 [Synechococcus sp. Cruz-9H2]|uniref:hypothetical protein n=1 Tax=unclassified Synechococcus TaxID=2626047 RepID=UPI0020CBDEAC|nr:MULTISPECIES: hypothetical protein [unclassified Synechococcus]MCP9819276.1 hypothetical protein [Synechococcus sp. Cruz-9H2]MCP9843070.1 hypothetical protein [Synechococcus sp. Edmonson 11F2]MCP9854814.1 hypothetical protein [Synechococcus sp. Cruz-9C9]MCP9862715.1 hypothetical protein [Synechococcus sp. Cruz-7E5]MCP9870186.1 hypothetical protein [Synechococcus sp. Cruz-7B9]